MDNGADVRPTRPQRTAPDRTGSRRRAAAAGAWDGQEAGQRTMFDAAQLALDALHQAKARCRSRRRPGRGPQAHGSRPGAGPAATAAARPRWSGSACRSGRPRPARSRPPAPCRCARWRRSRPRGTRSARARRACSSRPRPWSSARRDSSGESSAADAAVATASTAITATPKITMPLACAALPACSLATSFARCYGRAQVEGLAEASACIVNHRLVLLAGLSALARRRRRRRARTTTTGRHRWSAVPWAATPSARWCPTLAAAHREGLRIVSGAGLLLAGPGLRTRRCPAAPRSRRSSTSSISWRPPATSPRQSTRRAAMRS